MHSLMVSDSESRRRQSVARWVDEELAIGAKVYYTGWDAGETHWLVGPGGARAAREAVESGQLELLDMDRVIERTGGCGKQLAEANLRGTRKALDEGWTRIAMSADSPRRVLDESDTDALELFESAVDDLVAEHPVTVLCQLAVPEESDAAVWERVAAHHRDLVDETWSALESDGFWCPRGELDAYVARRFGAALHAALRGTGDPPRDLHVDLSGVEFMDVACARLLALAARDAASGQRLVLHRPSRTVRRLIDAVGRPRTVVFSDTEASGWAP